MTLLWSFIINEIAHSSYTTGSVLRCSFSLGVSYTSRTRSKHIVLRRFAMCSMNALLVRHIRVNLSSRCRQGMPHALEELLHYYSGLVLDRQSLIDRVRRGYGSAQFMCSVVHTRPTTKVERKGCLLIDFSCARQFHIYVTDYVNEKFLRCITFHRTSFFK